MIESLECPLCGSEAVMADDDGLFYETVELQSCLSCGYPGRVNIGESDEAREVGLVWWSEVLDDDHPAVKAWREANPIQAAELDAIGYISTLRRQA